MPHFMVFETVTLIRYIEAETADAAKAQAEAMGIGNFEEADVCKGQMSGDWKIEEYDPEG